MPRQKDLKRLVRARMDKTGEAYTAARANIIKKKRSVRPANSGWVADGDRPVAPKASEYARLAGMSDAKVKAQTGCTWERWVKALDHHGAENMSHREIAGLVSRKYKTPDWWAQTVTVGYERIKGLRARGQRRDGTYEVSKSRTFDVPVSELFGAWSDARLRRRWLAEDEARIRTATEPKSMRLDWTDGSIIAVGFVAKGTGKSSVAVQHTRLTDRATADRLRKYWSDRLDALGEALPRAGSASGA
ncbi:MAG TPA: hypothetical protein VHL32_09025 [Gemmatimonadaceae bacterium]|nr:hypothetical protein [Gemmatimonadaceae bacterium]